ncbi:MAG: acyl dehydratase [Proteobacteria bacterium]|nr:acyl dehydratase [Pseudomonadota bacterium]HQR02769.1 MaoC/PaaZ C-terminal domain-containing protein [Rhodocyclaceae bacterium]
MSHASLPVLGETLPQLSVAVTARMVIGAAFAARDLAPQHHDHRHALAAGLPDVIMNTPTLQGLLSRYATDTLGPSARVRRLRCRMKAPVCPGDALIIRGTVSARIDTVAGTALTLAISFQRDDRTVTEGEVEAFLPAGDAK